MTDSTIKYIYCQVISAMNGESKGQIATTERREGTVSFA